MRWFRKRRLQVEPDPQPVGQPAAPIPVMPEPPAEVYDFNFRRKLHDVAPEGLIRILERNEETIRLAMRLQVNVAIQPVTGAIHFMAPEDKRGPSSYGWIIVHCDKE